MSALLRVLAGVCARRCNIWSLMRHGSGGVGKEGVGSGKSREQPRAAVAAGGEQARSPHRSAAVRARMDAAAVPWCGLCDALADLQITRGSRSTSYSAPDRSRPSSAGRRQQRGHGPVTDAVWTPGDAPAAGGPRKGLPGGSAVRRSAQTFCARRAPLECAHSQNAAALRARALAAGRRPHDPRCGHTRALALAVSSNGGVLALRLILSARRHAAFKRTPLCPLLQTACRRPCWTARADS